MNEKHPDMQIINRIITEQPSRLETVVEAYVYAEDKRLLPFYDSFKALKRHQNRFRRIEDSFRKREDEKGEIFSEFKPLKREYQRELELACELLEVDTKGLLEEFSKKQIVRKGPKGDKLLFMKRGPLKPSSNYQISFFTEIYERFLENYFPKKYERLNEQNRILVKSRVSPFQTIQHQIGARLDYYNNYTLESRPTVKPYMVIVDTIDTYKNKSGSSLLNTNQLELDLISFNQKERLRKKKEDESKLKETYVDNSKIIDLQSLHYSNL